MAEGNTLSTFTIPSYGRGVSFVCFSLVFTKTHFTNEKTNSGSWRKVQETEFQMQQYPNYTPVSFFPCLPQERVPPRQSVRAPQKSCGGKSLASVQRTDDKARIYWARFMARLSSKYPTHLTSSPNYSMWLPPILPSSYRWENWSVRNIWLPLAHKSQMWSPQRLHDSTVKHKYY